MANHPASRSGLFSASGLAALLILVVGVAFAPPVSAAPQKELKELRGRIENLQKQLDTAEASKSSAADSLRESEQAISQINRKLHDLSLRQQDTAAALKDLNARTADTRHAIQNRQDQLAKLVYQQYIHGRQDYLKLLLNRQDPNDIARDLHYYTYISRAQANLIQGLQDDLRQLDQLTAETRAKSDTLAQIQTEQANQKRQLEKEQENRKAVLSRLSQQISGQRKELSRLKENEKQLTALVERLARAAAQAARAARAKARVHAGSKSEGISNTRVPDAAFAGIPFSDLKGKLRLPVVGELTNRFGGPREDTGTPWKGLFIKAREGQPVKAIASGRVVFADWLRGFGNLIIVDHGDGYMSLYADNESLYKQVGEQVKAGDTIATVGNSGGNPQTGLYFELRHESKPLDPLNWITLK